MLVRRVRWGGERRGDKLGKESDGRCSYSTSLLHMFREVGVDLEGIRNIFLKAIPLLFPNILLISTGRMAFWPSKLAVTNSITMRLPLGSRLS